MFGQKTKGDVAAVPGHAHAPTPASAAAVPERAPGDSILGPNLTLKGEVSFEDGLTIEGAVEGRVSGQGMLTVGQGGRILGDVMAASILVRGRVQGNITAADRLEIASTAMIVGDIHAERLVVAEGARIMGRVEVAAENLSMPAGRSDGKSEARNSDALEKVF